MDGSRLSNLRLLLLGDIQVAERDDLIILLFGYAETRMKLIVEHMQLRNGLSADGEIPETLDWIVDEVVAKRFNRIGSEGYSQESIDGHSVNFSSSDFAEYLGDIAAYFESQGGGSSRAKVVPI